MSAAETTGQVAATPTAAAPVAVAMSGGVDSSTAAALLHRRGVPIVGLTMQLWNQQRLGAGAAADGKRAGGCCSIEDVRDARRVAESLGIPFYVVNYEERFEREVVQTFVAQYAAGRTPIPCSLCNTAVKFDQLLTTARQIGAEKVATGHYARVGRNAATGEWELRRGRDDSKDQTFFLWGLNQEQLSRAEFPLGEMRKPEVRALAAELGVATADKPDSHEICFIPDNNYTAFLDAYAAEQGGAPQETAGEVVTRDGRPLGPHSGVQQFTVGQRKGLGLASRGLKETGNPLYVLQIDAAAKRVVVGEDRDLYARELRASGAHWISGRAPSGAVRAQARIRHRHAPAAAWVEPLADRRLRVAFDEPQRAITPGQSVVLYQEDLVLGGAWIDG